MSSKALISAARRLPRSERRGQTAPSRRHTTSAQIVAGTQPINVKCRIMHKTPWTAWPRRNIASHGATKQTRIMIMSAKAPSSSGGEMIRGRPTPSINAIPSNPFRMEMGVSVQRSVAPSGMPSVRFIGTGTLIAPCRARVGDVGRPPGSAATSQLAWPTAPHTADRACPVGYSRGRSRARRPGSWREGGLASPEVASVVPFSHAGLPSDSAARIDPKGWRTGPNRECAFGSVRVCTPPPSC